MELSSITIQLIGALGYFFLANSYFNKEKGKLLIVQIVSNFLLSVHFFLLAGIGGAICNMVCIFADIVIYFHDKYIGRRKVLLASLLIVFLLVTFFATLHLSNETFTYKELIPIFATSMIIISLVTDSKNIIRLIGLIAAVCWLVYGIIFQSYAGIAFEVIIITSTIASYIREKVKERK